MSNKYEMTGRLIVLNDAQTFGSGFTKREFVIRELEGKYPQDVKFEVVKDKCAEMDSFRFGDELKVSFNVRGNEHNGKYYVSLQAWRIEAVCTPQSAHDEAKANGYQPQRATDQNGAQPPAIDTSDNDDDSIPF